MVARGRAALLDKQNEYASLDRFLEGSRVQGCGGPEVPRPAESAPGAA